MDKALAIRLERIKDDQRLKIEEFTEIMGVTKTAFYNWLEGKNNPNSDILVKVLLKYPQYSPEWLLMGTGEMYREKGLDLLAEPETKYNSETLVKKVEELSEELNILKQRFDGQKGVIKGQGQEIVEKNWGLSPQKRPKKKN